MIDPNSRYARIETIQWIAPDGRVILYLRRRFPPPGASLEAVSEVVVQPGERLDHIAASSAGDPLAFWQICDANDAIDPLELTRLPGRTLRIALPKP